MIARTIATPDNAPAGTRITVPFGVNSQLAVVVAWTKAGNLQVRAWVASRREWTPTVRTIDPNAQPVYLSDHKLSLPVPLKPAAKPRAKAAAAAPADSVSEPMPAKVARNARAETRALRARLAPGLWDAFKAHRAAGLSVHASVIGARKALAFARSGRPYLMPQPRRAARLDHGDVIRSRGADGSRRTYVVAHIADHSMGAPWIEHDGHGVIRELAPYAIRPSKRPGERPFGTPGNSVYVYDIPATLEIAKRDEWGLSPESRAALAAKLGREPTAKQIRAAAVAEDFERMRGWVRDEWSWIGVALIRLPRGPHSPMPQSTADAWAHDAGNLPGDMAASLWGIESDAGDYLDTVARDLLSEANAPRDPF